MLIFEDNIMRSVYSISLAGLFILNSIGGIGILCYHHYRIHSYIESIRTENYSGQLHQFEFNDQESDDLIWFKDGREFSHLGRMYDVVRTEVTNDGRTVYHCIRDEKENEIFGDMANNFSHSTSGPNQDHNLMLQFFRFLSNILIVPPSVAFTDHHEILKDLFSYKEAFHTVYISVACEPPDIL